MNSLRAYSGDGLPKTISYTRDRVMLVLRLFDKVDPDKVKAVAF